MGWLRQIVLGDLGQSLDINEATDQLNTQARIQVRQRTLQSRQEQNLAQLKARTERLHLAVTALGRFLVKSGVVNEKELGEFLDELDRDDGFADGRMPFNDTPPKPKLLTPGTTKHGDG